MIVLTTCDHFGPLGTICENLGPFQTISDDFDNFGPFSNFSTRNVKEFHRLPAGGAILRATRNINSKSPKLSTNIPKITLMAPRVSKFTTNLTHACQNTGNSLCVSIFPPSYY